MNNLKNQIKQFCYTHTRKKVAIILHTSVVQEKTVDLSEITSSSFVNLLNHICKKAIFYLPEDSEAELKLLKNHSNYGSYRTKATYLLTSPARVTSCYNEIIRDKRVWLSNIGCDVALFIFYEPAMAEDFSQKMGKVKDVYVYSVDIYNENFNTQSLVGTRLARRACQPLELKLDPYSIPFDDELIVKDRFKTITHSFKLSELTYMTNGGEATIYTHPVMSGLVYKIFWFKLSDHMVNKIKMLMQFCHIFVQCAAPISLIYHNNQCVGYVMEHVEGMDLSQYLNVCEDSEYTLKLLARNIAVVLLELRMAQLVITDLSSGNIHINDKGKVIMTDVDSYQFYFYPGGGLTAPYGHPDVTEAYFYQKYRKQDHLNFSFAVMLFDIFMGWNNPLLQKKLGDVTPTYRQHKFPYANSFFGKGVEARGCKANQDKLQVWKQQPLNVREGFVDVFTFKTTYSVGQWLNIFKLV